jgi:hypothetical protein
MRLENFTCERCGEYWFEAKRRQGMVCQNCGDTSHERVRRCPICGRKDVPSHFHHIASERQHPTFGITICLNCHAIVTYRQMTKWHPTWRTEPHPIRCIVQGMLDMLCLWWERNPAVAAVSDMWRVILRAGIEIVGCLYLAGWDFA